MKIFKYALLFFIVFLNAQTHRFVYEVQYKRDSTELDITKSNYILDVNPDKIMYYNYSFYVADSTIAANPGGGFFPPKDFNIYKRLKNSKEYTHAEAIGFDSYRLMESADMKWKVLPDKKTTQGYTLQKAITRWGGRNWIAWFASEIPFQYGPYEFNGLPGLIFEIEDDKANYKYHLVRSQKFDKTYKSEQVDYFIDRSLPVNREKYKKLKLDFYQDPLIYLNNGKVDLSKVEGIGLEDGTMVTAKNKKEVTEVQSKLIKKYNNPINLDTAIHYPEK